jgi:hypothetical protein
MPIHDWSRVSAGVFHDFHHSWIARLRDVLNERVLPSDFYALAEQQAGNVQPDVITLQAEDDQGDTSDSQGGGLMVADAPPQVWLTQTYEEVAYILKRRTLTIRSSSDDRIVALIEIMSPGNKSGVHAFEQFVEKVLASIEHGIHVLVVDVHKPTKRDPDGIHGAVIEALNDYEYSAPNDKRLTLVSYEAGIPLNAYIQPVAIGDAQPKMPLFLERGRYVNVPLEETYVGAFQGVPQRFKQRLAAS